MGKIINIQSILDEAISLIDQNLPRILETRFEATMKVDDSPVTASDLFLEQLITDFLHIRIPNIRVISEESFDGNDQENTGLTALIDPIDGTENFTSGLPIWGVAVTIWDGNEHLGSLLHLPELQKSLRTGTLINPISSRIKGFSSSLSEELISELSKVKEARIMGCSVFNFYNVSTGVFQSLENPVGAFSWDLLAGISLAKEFGCQVEIDGKEYDGRYLKADRKYRFKITRS